jgi:hypothetical protein
MERKEVKQIFDDLKTYCPYCNSDDQICITEWANTEGWDITIRNKSFSLHRDELTAIETLTRIMDYHYESVKVY